MELKELKKALEIFGKAVILKSKKKLNSKSNLAKSLDYNIKESKNSIELSFLMEEYGLYKDLGVQGKNPSELPEGARKYNKQQAPRSPYKFGSGTGKKGGLKKAIDKWIVRKNIKGTRNKLGQFTSRKSIGFLIRRSIFLSGIKPSLFFTTPFRVAYKSLPKEIASSFAKDVEAMIKPYTTS